MGRGGRRFEPIVASLLGVVTASCSHISNQLAGLEGKGQRLQEQKCPARPRTRQARRGQPGDESRTACCRPDPSLPCPPRPSRKGTRIAPSPAPPCVCSKVALVLFPPAGAGCSVGCHSPWQLAIITAILQSRLSAAVLGGPQVPPRQGQCHPPALDQAYIRRRRRPLVSFPPRARQTEQQRGLLA